VEITSKINMDSYRIQQTSSGSVAAPLSEIVKYVNQVYGTAFTTEDKVKHFVWDLDIYKKLTEDDRLRELFQDMLFRKLEAVP